MTDKKLCPLLVMGFYASTRTEEGILGPDVTGTACVREACAWWVAQHPEHGECAIRWVGGCIEYHVQIFNNGVAAIAEAIAAQAKPAEKLAKAIDKLTKAVKARAPEAGQEGTDNG